MLANVMKWTLDSESFGLRQWQLNFNGLTLSQIVEPIDGIATVFPLVGSSFTSDKGLEQLQQICEFEAVREMIKACNQVMNNHDTLRS